MNKTYARAGVGITLLGLVMVIGSWLTPATAHIGTPSHLWTEHIRPRADLRYLQNTHVYVSTAFSLGSLADLTVTRLCPRGNQALGGGVDFEAADADVQVISSAPLVGGKNLFALSPGRNAAARGWRVTLHNNGVLAVDGVVGVICSR
jgi:hypothetical protein